MCLQNRPLCCVGNKNLRRGEKLLDSQSSERVNREVIQQAYTMVRSLLQ
jgi:hypothetical protein